MCTNNAVAVGSRILKANVCTESPDNIGGFDIAGELIRLIGLNSNSLHEP